MKTKDKARNQSWSKRCAALLKERFPAANPDIILDIARNRDHPIWLKMEPELFPIWREKDGGIRLTIVTTGLTAKRLKTCKLYWECAAPYFASKAFSPTNGVQRNCFISEKVLTPQEMRDKKLRYPTPEVALYVSEFYSEHMDKMKLRRIFIMHRRVEELTHQEKTCQLAVFGNGRVEAVFIGDEARGSSNCGYLYVSR